MSFGSLGEAHWRWNRLCGASYVGFWQHDGRQEAESDSW